jgi:glucosamine--fructose-6-phosphate aminotransferase (isomerizing)
MSIWKGNTLSSLMYEEALSAADAVAAQHMYADEGLAVLGRELATTPPTLALTVARGSSDHAASYFAYLAMQRLGVPVVSLPMSLVTLHHAPLVVKGQLAVALSQSGQSPDLIDTMSRLAEAGARTVALVNKHESPLAAACEWSLPLCAGEEKSVAATKSYIASLSAVARLVAHWQGDATLLQALDQLPAQLQQACRQDWRAAIPVLACRTHHGGGARAGFCRGAGSRAQVQGNLCHPGRGVFRCRNQTWPDGPDRRRLSAAGVCATRAGTTRPDRSG